MSHLLIAAILGCIVAIGSMTVPSQQPTTPRGSASRPIVLFDEIPAYGDVASRVAAIEARRFLVVYQSADPKAASTGLIDTAAVIRAIRKEGDPNNLPAWGMLDFEDPFHDLLQKGPATPECNRTVAEMVRTIEAVRKAFPRTKWCFYGAPWLPYWLEGGKDWTTAPDSVKRRELDRAIAIYAPIIAASDWVSPTIYGKYDPKLYPEAERATIRSQGRAWRSAQVGVARVMARAQPVIPLVCPWWTPGGKAEYCRLMDPIEFIEDQVAPAIAEGASGAGVWAALGYQINRMTAADASRFVDEKDFGLREWRAAVVKDYLGGREPADWSAPGMAAFLRASMSSSMVKAMEDISALKLREPAGQVPAATK